MPKFIFVLFAIVFTSISSGQNTFNLKGKVIDEVSKQPIEAATVYVSSVKDSSVVNYTITDKLGKFDFKVKKNDKPVYLKVSYINYQDYKFEIKSFSESKDFGTISLKEAIKNLDEVVIKNEAPPIRIKKDTLEFNASSFKVRPDANVETLLKQLPGVEIDSDGKITVNGKEVNQVLVNGKPFFDKDGKIALQNLPSEIIKKVQVTDTKTKKEEQTKKEASSNNSSINLTIDEDKNKGFFGKFMGGYGTDKHYESSMLLNYFKSKRKISVLASSNNINSVGFSMDEIFDNMSGGRARSMNTYTDGSFSINGRYYGNGSGITQSKMVGINYADEWFKKTETSGSYFYSNAENKNENKILQTNFLPSGNFATASNTTSSNSNSGHNFNYQFEYKIDSTATLTFEPKLSIGNSKSYNKSYQKSTDANDSLLNESNSENNNSNEASTFGNTLTFTKIFKRKGRYLNLTLENENTKTDKQNTSVSNTVFYQGTTPNDARNQFIKERNLKDNYNAEIEYSEPITDSLKIQLATKIKYNKLSEDKKTFDFDSFFQSYSAVNDVLTNYQTSLNKTIQPTTGIVYEKKKFNFNMNLGTSIINFDNHSLYLNDVTDLNKNYILPFVSVNYNYKFSKSKNFRIGYNYEIDVPSSNEVLPVEDLSNPLNTYIGNPNLDMNKNHNVYLSFRNYDYTTRSGYGVYFGGDLYDNQVVSSTSYDVNRKRTTTYENVSGNYSSWFGTYWNKSIKKEAHNFRFGLNINGGYNVSKGFTDLQLYNANSLRLNNRASFAYEYGELFTINPSYTYSWNKTNYENYFIDAASSFTHKFNLQVTNFWPKNWTFGNDFGYTYNSNIANGFKKDFYLWNTSLSYSFYNKKFIAKVKVYDLLNQNQNASRTITATTIRDEENIVLKRYMMFSLTYKIGNFAGKEKKSNRFSL